MDSRFSSDASHYPLISHILEIEGFACLPASDCAKALELLPQRPFTAVLLDCTIAAIHLVSPTPLTGSAKRARNGQFHSLPCSARFLCRGSWDLLI